MDHQIKTVGIIGAGQMGNGIAHVASVAGFDIRLHDIAEDRINAALATIDGNMARQVAKGAIGDEDRRTAMSRIVSAPKLEELLQSGEIAMTVVARSRAVALKKEGLPLQAVEPEEGAAALMVTMCPVVDSDVPAQAQEFIQHMLSPEIQKVFAKAGYGPVNRKTELTEQEKEGLAVGDEAVGKLAKIDWPVVNQNRAAWTQRWNREVER